MRVLIVLDYFRPAYKAGGPIRIFENFAHHPHAGHLFGIVAQNIDVGETRPLPVQEGVWAPFEHARVLYVSPSRIGFAAIRRILRDFKPDVVHLNTFFSRVWTLKLLILNRFGQLGAPLFLSPHGEFAGGALALADWRCRAFLTLARWLGLFKSCIWIATAKQEIKDIRSAAGQDAFIKLVSLPFPHGRDNIRSPKSKGALRLIFFARLTAIKNLHFLVDVLPYVQGHITFDIYGPIDPSYSNRSKETIARLQGGCPHCDVVYRGAVSPEQALDVLSKYDLFIQPSLSESFGYSIVEALSVGTPVLISDRTQWQDINVARVGFALPLERPDLWIRTLQEFIDFDAAEWEHWSNRSKSWAQRNADHGESLLAAYASPVS